MNRVLILDLNLDPTGGTIACTHPKLVFSETYKCPGHLRAVHALRLISRDTGQAIETAIATDPTEKCDKFVAGKETCPAIAGPPLDAAFVARLPGKKPRNVTHTLKLPIPWSSGGVSRETSRSANASDDVLRHDHRSATHGASVPRGDIHSFNMRQHRYPGPTEAFANLSTLAKLGCLRVKCMGAVSRMPSTPIECAAGGLSILTHLA